MTLSIFSVSFCYVRNYLFLIQYFDKFQVAHFLTKSLNLNPAKYTISNFAKLSSRENKYQVKLVMRYDYTFDRTHNKITVRLVE